MALDFPGHDEAMRRTLEIAERCNVSLELGNILLPKFPLPDGKDAFEYLVELCEKGLQKRYDRVTPELQERLRFELKTIKEMGFADYFLIVWDFIAFARRDGVSVGPGRGSAAGLARRLLPRDHRRRPDPLRPALRALPQPGPQVDAGHGHRLRRRRARPGHQLRRGEVRARPRGPDHHLRDDDGPRRRPRRRSRARGPLRLRRQGRENDPGRPEGLPRRVPQAGIRAEAGLRRRPDRAGDRRPREAARGPHPAGLDPRGRGRDLRPAVDRHRPAAAEGQRPGGRDAVRDVGRRGARPAEDGLPRPAQPRRDRQGGRAGRQRRHLQAPARRPCHLRDAPARRRDRRLPVRVVGHARGAAVGQADRVRGSDRARRPLPARADGLHPRLREAQERPGGGDVHRSAARADHGRHPRDLHLPGAVPRDREADRGVHAGRGRRSAQGDRQEDPRR